MSKLSQFIRSFGIQPAAKVAPTNPFELDLRDFGFDQGYFASPPFMMDLNSTRSVLEGRAYPIIPYIDPPKTIVDCGGNAGATACYFAKLYPAANILSFEPSAYVFEFHRRNTRQFSNITGYNFGLSDCTGKVELLSGLESHSIHVF